MLDGRPYGRMPVDPDPETATRVGWILTALLFLLAVVSLAGEFLGWWNDLGEIGTIVGTLGSLLVGVATYQHGADRAQVGHVHRAVTSNGETLSSLETKADDQLDELEKLERLEQLDELDKLEQLQHGQAEQTRVLEAIRDRLSPGDADVS